jgi:hypothetical protein
MNRTHSLPICCLVLASAAVSADAAAVPREPCQGNELVFFDIHGPAVSCPEYKEALRVAPNRNGGTAAPIVEAADALRRLEASACVPPAAARQGVRVTFGPNGRVAAVIVERGWATGTPAAACLVGAFQAITVPAYRGGAFSLRRESGHFRGWVD